MKNFTFHTHVHVTTWIRGFLAWMPSKGTFDAKTLGRGWINLLSLQIYEMVSHCGFNSLSLVTNDIYGTYSWYANGTFGSCENFCLFCPFLGGLCSLYIHFLTVMYKNCLFDQFLFTCLTFIIESPVVFLYKNSTLMWPIGIWIWPAPPLLFWASLVAQTVKRLPAMRETRVQSLGWEDLLEKEMAAHSSIAAWRIPWTEEPGRLQSMGSQRVGHDWATSLWKFQVQFIFIHYIQIIMHIVFR